MSQDTDVKGADLAPRDSRRRLRRLGRAMRRHKWRSGIAIVGVIAMLLTGGMFVAAAIWTAVDDRKAKMTTEGPYRGTVESLNSHQVPGWYAGAKLGIMIHWGPYSVPGYAPKGTFAEILKTNYDNAMVSHPYAEDYQNAMKDPTSPTGRYHAEHYGTQPYEEFGKQFEKGLAGWNADEWAKTFHDAGARYVVMVAKYADGYSLWPTEVVNPHRGAWHSRRDLVGELAAAVRKLGLKFGVYYSGGVDWTFQRHIVRTLGDYAYLPYDGDYADYATAQVRELIRRYKPDLLWNDILWPTGQKRLSALMADYYNTVPDGVLNDRWTTTSFWHRGGQRHRLRLRQAARRATLARHTGGPSRIVATAPNQLLGAVTTVVRPVLSPRKDIMKLLLTSAGIKNPSIHNALVDLLGKPIAECSALCIPTAGYGFPEGDRPGMAYRFITGQSYTPICELGWKSLGVLELTALPSVGEERWVPWVREADALLVGGGDALYLSHWMRQSGLADLLPSLPGKVWAGVSAGSMAMAPRVGEDFVGWRPPSGVDEALGVVEFSIFPHLDHPDLSENTMAEAEKWAAGLPNPAYAIDDDTAIRVVDGTVEIVSEGHWKLFTP